MAEQPDLPLGAMECDVDALLARLDDLDAVAPADAWPQTLADLFDILTDHYTRRRDHPEADARREAEEIVILLAHWLGGRPVYLPRDDSLRRALRDADIYRDFGRRSAAELAQAHRLTPMQIYHIIQRQRRLHQGRVQRELFPEE